MRNKNLLILLICLIALAACSNDPEPTAESTEIRATATTAVIETAAVEPTALPDQPSPTMVPTPTAVQTLPICNQPLDPPSQPAGTLHVRYWSGNQLWLWSEQGGEPENFTIETSSSHLTTSPDGRFIAFTRPAEEEDAVELWIADIDSRNEQLLATASSGDLLTRYPNAVRADFLFYWRGTADDLALVYRFQAVFDALGDVPAEPETVIDIASGQSRILEPSPNVKAAVSSPDSQQTAVVIDDVVQLRNSQQGSILFTIPVSTAPTFEQVLTYSPDGNSLVYFTANGIALINTHDGKSQEIPLTYESIGLGHYTAVPGIYWTEDGAAFYTIVTDNQQVFDQEATISLWYVELASGQGQLLHAFNGSFLSADLSPDRKLLAFWLQNVNNRRLFLADVATGAQIEYASGKLVDFLSWNPDGRHFLYWLPDERKPILGHPCQPPVAFAELGFPEIADNIRWIDADRFLYINSNGDSSSWTIYLNNLNGQSQAVGTVEGELPQIEFYFVP